MKPMYIVMFYIILVSYTPSMAQLSSQLTGMPQYPVRGIAFQGSGIRLVYPDRCARQDTKEFLLYLSCRPNDVKVIITHSKISEYRSATTIEEVDEADWRALLTTYERISQKEGVKFEVKLESRNLLKIDGQPAIERTFSVPGLQYRGTRQYKMTVSTMKGTALYHITAIATSISDLQQAGIKDILASIQLGR